MGRGCQTEPSGAPISMGPLTHWEVKEDKDSTHDIVSDNTDHKHVLGDLSGCKKCFIVSMEKVLKLKLHGLLAKFSQWSCRLAVIAV